ncbi:MAG: ABC transporter permease, partial [Gammaproteobacteria bacterium]|nr:ABC transporter permease [Gammaproteobacteria bacterium]
MNLISLTPIDLSIAAALVVLLALSSLRLELGVGKQIIVAGVRKTIRLMLIGMVL